jgi:hypothetical protein
MTDNQHNTNDDATPANVNPGYAMGHIAKALTTIGDHPDAATRERAKERVMAWATVLQNIVSGAVNYGSRAPLASVPVWATPEVVTGGFVTGKLLAGGPLQDHEQKLCDTIPTLAEHRERGAINAYYLTDAGLADLQKKLQTNQYKVTVPEEGALLTVAWLVEHNYFDEARALLTEISPHFSDLRFYPVPLDHPQRAGSRAHLQNVGDTINNLRAITPNARVLAQREASEIWAPYYDRIIALFIETVVDGWPCQHYPPDWRARAQSLLASYNVLRRTHQLCGKPERRHGHFAQSRELLRRCATAPRSLTGRQVGRIRQIVDQYVQKRGEPGSVTCIEARRRQVSYVSNPMFHDVAQIVLTRLEKHRGDEALDDVGHLQQPVDWNEAVVFQIPESTPIPESIQRKVERCLSETIDVLVERGLITSGETLARVLPQTISALRSAGISDPALRNLYASIYRAFRRRRSLLLLNLEKQVQLEELPWVAAIEQFRTENLSDNELARQALEEITLLTTSSFPHAILPNKLLQELRALAKGANLHLPLVEEVAADIFMGQFSHSFRESAQVAAQVVDQTLYAKYYAIDYDEIRRLPVTKQNVSSVWSVFRNLQTSRDEFAQLCASRAGVELGTWNPATNGMIIEQQQILTTQNLAALFSTLHLTDSLHDRLGEMARECFVWICRRHQMKIDRYHAWLIMLKNSAYAWRQMIFYLSLLSETEQRDFVAWADQHLQKQNEEFHIRFRPALNGLALTVSGGSIDRESVWNPTVRRFLGWSKSRHWLAPAAA